MRTGFVLLVGIIVGGVAMGAITGALPIQEAQEIGEDAINSTASDEQQAAQGNTTETESAGDGNSGNTTWDDILGTDTPKSTKSTTIEDQGEATPTSGPTHGAEGYNWTEVEMVFIQLLNEERKSRGLQKVSQRNVLTEMGYAHAKDMAKHDYLGHKEPDGTTIEDRYRQRGLLPECELPLKNSNQFYPGAENAYQGYIDSRIRQDDGSIIYVTSEDDLAQAIFESWMGSPPHRKAMLVYSADEAGLGTAKVDGSDKVYSALELC